MTYSELKKILSKNGCYIYRDGSNHEIWYSPITGNKFPVSRHKKDDVKQGTLRAIADQAGIKL